MPSDVFSIPWYDTPQADLAVFSPFQLMSPALIRLMHTHPIALVPSDEFLATITPVLLPWPTRAANAHALGASGICEVCSWDEVRAWPQLIYA